MRADIAFRECAQNGVDQGMQRNVGIRMSRQRSRMRNAHAAEPNVVAFHEGMYIISGRGADIGKSRHLGRGQAGKVVRRGQLDIAGLAFKNRDCHAGPFGQRRIVGEIVAPGRGSTVMCRQKFLIAKCLGRLHGAQAVAIERLDHPALGIDRFDGIGQRHGGDCRPPGTGRNGTGNEGRRGKGSRRIVHQDDLRRFMQKRFKPGSYRGLARVTAKDSGLQP